MSLLFKTIYYPGNAKAEYQKQGKTWVKRAKGSKNEFVPLDYDAQKILNSAFKDKGFLYYYNPTVVIGGSVLILAFSYYVYKQIQSFKKLK